MYPKEVSTIFTVSFDGLQVNEIMIQVQLSQGIPSLTIVGLPDKIVLESKERVRSALSSLNISLPPKKIIINLSPADVHKTGNHFDLPIAICLLKALKKIDNDSFSNIIVMGEIGLDGAVYGNNGVLPAALWCQKHQKHLLISTNNSHEISQIRDNNIKYFHISHLEQILKYKNIDSLNEIIKETPDEYNEEEHMPLPSPIFGHTLAKRVLSISILGNHNLLIFGPPGSGKSSLVRWGSFLKGQLTYEESLETSSIHSRAGCLSHALIKNPPIFFPHHTASAPSILGGGAFCKPGIISLGHNGIVFFDEFLEFHRSVIDALRQPLEMGYISISRAKYTISYPARFLFIAASNPCKCGYFGSEYRKCICHIKDVKNYLSKISGPIKQRIALTINMDIQRDFLSNCHREDGISWAYEYKKKIHHAKIFQKHNKFPQDPMEIYRILHDSEKLLLQKILDTYNFSTREMYNILKVSRTIADLEQSININKIHIQEAASYISFFMKH